MQIVEGNLEKELFKSFQRCEEKIIIISPFISLTTVEKLVKTIKKHHIKCVVVTRFERKSFIENASSLDALKVLIENGVQVFSLKELHSKVYLIDDTRCFVGSANFTNKGLNINHEILLCFEEKNDVEKVKSYTNNLMTRIKESGDWLLTPERIQAEKEIVESYKENQGIPDNIGDSWGAVLKSDETPDENAVVLSVPVGGTIHLVENFLVHAHPATKGYNYTPTEYITFRKANGGIMNNIYKIVKTFSLEMNEWKRGVDDLDLPVTIKENINNYIINRYRDFDFDKATKYKFYLLNLSIELPNEPHPQANNAGGWLYTMKDLLESEGHVYTIRQKQKR